ncbi:MAG: bifunctional metallophosphatase/5'-nucleotidase [Chloroflexi bacterium]|nr:bifunctional metallophosphatase/5'-nucleotidase [Chloroflexota bacterium]
MAHLTIMHTNDVHGRLMQLARIATLAKRIRREAESRESYCALLDAGDIEDPSLFESSMTKGSAAMALLRAAGYNHAVLGNASTVRYGPQIVPELVERFGKRLLCANMFDPNTDRLWQGLEPFTIETLGEIKVAIIGMTAPMSIYSVFDVRMVDPVTILPGLIAQVRAGGAQIVILLSHLGSPDDQKVAEQVTGIDLIIGGHDHQEIYPPKNVNGTLIVQTGDYGRFLGRLDLEIDTATGKVTNYDGKLLPVSEDIPLDADVMKAYATEQERVHQMTLRVIGELRAPIDFSEEHQCAAGDLMADALLERVRGAEIALALAGHWRGGLEAGTVTFGQLNDAIRSSANPARTELTGEQIMQFLCNALKLENMARQLSPLRGVAVGMPHVAGMTVRYDAASRQVVDVRVGDESLQFNRKYVVAATDLEFFDLVGYLVIPQEQITYEVPTILPEVIEDYIAHHSPLDAPKSGRIVADP